MQELLKISDLQVTFAGESGPLPAVDGLDLSLPPGKVMGLVGESGSGKTMTALAVMGLLPSAGRVSRGEILYKGESLLSLPPARLRGLRGREMAMIFQEPMTSLNPVFRVGEQIAEGIMAHGEANKLQAMERAVEALAKVGIPDPANRAKAFPHQLSGGMRQRVMIAMALAMDPHLLFADEPTTALDVTIQAQILSLLNKLQSETGAAVLLITHNLAVVAQMAETVAVMYAGRLVEEAPVGELFKLALHPYTQGLMACLPYRAPRGKPLSTIGGVVPPLGELPPGCAFSNRCPRAFEPCHRAEPALVEVSPGRRVRCYLHHSRQRREAA